MKIRQRVGGAVLLGAVPAMIVLAAGVVSSQESNPQTTRATMRGVFVVLKRAYAHSLDEKAFAAPENRQEILSELEALAGNTEQLEGHGGGLDPSFDFMRRSLSWDAHEALADFKSGNYVGSRFILDQITSNCATCHTKLPAERTFAAGHEFLTDIDAAKFPPIPRANLQVATRQFPDAMKTYEDILKSSDVSSADLDLNDVFANYLKIALGALNDTKRPIATLTAFAARPDIPDALKVKARTWVESLQALNLNVPAGDALGAARRMVEKAQEMTPSRTDQSGLVDFIGSIALAHRYLHAGPHGDQDTAEAYYLLGVAESYVSHSYWISETDNLLEKAIRKAPKSDVAKRALAFLEDYRRSGYDATPARELPPDMQTNIEELRKLVGP